MEAAVAKEGDCPSWITMLGVSNPQLFCNRPIEHYGHHASRGGCCWDGSGKKAKQLYVKHGWSLCCSCLCPYKKEHGQSPYMHACPLCRAKEAAEESARKALVEQARKRNEEVRKGRLQKYGISHQDYLALYRAQGGKCAVCHKARPPIRFSRPVTNVESDDAMPLVVDHCHETEVVRGLLCNACNTAEGLLGSDPETIENLLVYVRHFKDGGKNSTLVERGVQ